MIDFNKISQDRKRVSSFSQGGIAKGCGAIMANRRKKQKAKTKKSSSVVSGHKGLAKWFKQDWVDIGSKKKVEALPSVVGQNKKDAKENTPSVPRAKAMRMTKSKTICCIEKTIKSTGRWW